LDEGDLSVLRDEELSECSEATAECELDLEDDSRLDDKFGGGSKFTGFTTRGRGAAEIMVLEVF
jgi:hypothetical protein